MKILGSGAKVVGLAVVTLFMSAVTATASFAHVTVKPGEVGSASYQVFTVNVPNEKEIPTVSVKVLVPDSVASVTPTKKAGWTISTEKEGSGHDAKVTSITWSGSEITDGLREEFTFSAKTPVEPTELQWKAYQTYADGTVVSWDQKESEEGHGHGIGADSGPYSVTNVTDLPTVAGDSHDHNEEIEAAQTAADRGMYLGAAGLAVGLIAVFLATRKNG